MILPFSVFEGLLNKKFGEEIVMVEASLVFPDRVRVLRIDRKSFTFQQHAIIKKYTNKNTIENVGCYHFLVEEDLLGTESLRVGKNS